MPLSDYLVPINHDYEERIVGCNPCDKCSRHIAECPWLHSDKPVPGWIVEPSALPYGTKSDGAKVHTYHITYCPLYQPPKPRRIITPKPGGGTVLVRVEQKPVFCVICNEPLPAGRLTYCSDHCQRIGRNNAYRAKYREKCMKEAQCEEE